MSDASDDLNRSFDVDDHDDDAFAQQVFAAMRDSASAHSAREGRLSVGAGSTASDGAVDGDDRASIATSDDSASTAAASRTSASRLLEALEALAQDADGDGIPQSLRGASTHSLTRSCADEHQQTHGAANAWSAWSYLHRSIA